MTVWWLVIVGVAAFAGALYFSVFGAGVAVTTGANSFSYSAIGHRAFVETLRQLDVPVLVSRNKSAEKAGRMAVLVVAEPQARTLDDTIFRDLMTAERILLVLPKWKGTRDRRRRGWLRLVERQSIERVESILRRLVARGSIVRYTAPVSWRPGQLGVDPSLATPQLMVANSLTPVVSSDQGILVGELVRGRQHIWILSDPDVLSNHGLGLGDNAAFAALLIEGLRPADGAVVIDETIHGFQQADNLWRTIFELPFVATTALALATIIAVMWAAVGRFGAPIPVERPLSAGKTALIDNMAGLLQYGGHGSEVPRRYVNNTLRNVARRLHAPRKLDEDGVIEWVDRVGAARGVSATYRALRREADSIPRASGADSPRLARAAHNLYRWKQEMIDGS